MAPQHAGCVVPVAPSAVGVCADIAPPRVRGRRQRKPKQGGGVSDYLGSYEAFSHRWSLLALRFVFLCFCSFLVVLLSRFCSESFLSVERNIYYESNVPTNCQGIHDNQDFLLTWKKVSGSVSYLLTSRKAEGRIASDT